MTEPMEQFYTEIRSEVEPVANNKIQIKNPLIIPGVGKKYYLYGTSCNAASTELTVADSQLINSTNNYNVTFTEEIVIEDGNTLNNCYLRPVDDLEVSELTSSSSIKDIFENVCCKYPNKGYRATTDKLHQELCPNGYGYSEIKANKCEAIASAAGQDIYNTCVDEYVCEVCPVGKYGLNGVCKLCGSGKVSSSAGVSQCTTCAPHHKILQDNIQE